jgi:hypothetical protein
VLLLLLLLVQVLLLLLSAVLQLPCCQLSAVLLAALLLSHPMLLARALQPFQLMLQHFPRIVSPPAHPPLRCREVLELRLLLLHAAAPDAVCRIAAVRRMCSWDVVFPRRRLIYD